MCNHSHRTKKIRPQKLGGKKGENFLQAKISSNTVLSLSLFIVATYSTNSSYMYIYTCFGLGWFVVSPCPSLPWSPWPHVYSSPLVVMAAL